MGMCGKSLARQGVKVIYKRIVRNMNSLSMNKEVHVLRIRRFFEVYFWRGV